MSEKFAIYPSLVDRCVLITGGGSGIGAAMVEQFALQGARVAFVDVAEESSHALVTSLAGRCAHPPFFVPCDLTDIPATKSVLQSILSECGTPAVLVNNAASDDRHNFAEVTEEYWDQRMAVNLKHQFFAAQAIAPAMKAAGGGSIINMSSIAWMIPTPNLVLYNMAKAAIVGMTRALAHELGEANIRVNSVLPGAILTERQRRLWMSQEYLAAVLGKQCLKHNIAPEEVARLVLFLAADDSRSISNQSYIIDGGWI
jgi:NAD(P)-dependent dehydrogenase (short-subunit alcohol dehydrogenase family)